MNTVQSASPVDQLSRPALLYFLSVLAASGLLLSQSLPWWLLAVSGLCIGWRLLVFLGRISFPGKWLKASLVLLCCAGIAFDNRTGISLDAFVSLLLAGFALKSLEVYHVSDARRFLYVAFLVLMAYLLYNQGFLPAVFALVQSLLVLAALAAVHADARHPGFTLLSPLRTASIAMAFALPVLLVMFLVMPRLPPLWAMPLQKAQAKTGMSEEMRPGDIDQLAKSADLVMRVTFPAGVPPRDSLYWRGAILDTFDGRTWRNACDCNYQWLQTGAMKNPGAEPWYSVMLEPHGNKWLFTLPASSPHRNDVWGNTQGIFRYRKDVRERMAYDVWAVQETLPQPLTLLQADRNRYTQLPEGSNPRARALAKSLWLAAGTEAAMVRQVMDFYHQSFGYTLQPPLLGDNSVDDFLFTSKQGFCEHFAGSFVFLLRAAGIPARVVVGYQGGELQEQGNYVNVRQYDAHAWAEAWFPTRGWVRVDPTSAVAPERIQHGFASLFPESEALGGMLGINPFRPGSWLGYWRSQLDYLDYMVSRFVMEYDSRSQQSLLRDWGLESPWRLLALFMGMTGGLFAVFVIYLQWRDRHARREAPLTVAYRRACASYARCGVVRTLDETPLAYANRVQAAVLPNAAQFVELSARYSACCYGEPVAKPALRQQQRELQRALHRHAWRVRYAG